MKISKKFSTKAIVLACVLALALCCAVGGTIAWLVDKTATVENTFTYGDINIELKETNTGLDDDDDANTNTYKMIPGSELKKDPVVTVAEGSEDCWLFVKLQESDNFRDFMKYEMAAGWTPLNNDGVYYREVKATDTNRAFQVIKDDKVKVDGAVTKEMLNALGTDTNPLPTLNVTAYAIQMEGFGGENGALDAWTAALAQLNSKPQP